jgi:hypothetical protein
VDDPEYEVDDVRSQPLLSSPTITRQAIPPSIQLSGGWRLGLAAGTAVLALVVILSTWLPLQNQLQSSNGSSSPTPQAGFPSVTPQGAVTSVGVPTPLPITSSLAPPPANCPTAPPLTTITVPDFGGLGGSTVQLTGHAPVWIQTKYLPQSIVGVPEQAPPSSPMPAWWPSIFILWEIGPASHPTATIQVHDLRSGAPAWWSESGSGPQTPILVLPAPPDEPPSTVYSSYGTELFITHAGCYLMSVTWPGGRWSYRFAAGWGPTY